MKKDDLLDIIGMADDQLVERAADAISGGKARSPWKKWLPAAACAAIILCAVPAVMIAGGRKIGAEQTTTGIGDPFTTATLDVSKTEAVNPEAKDTDADPVMPEPVVPVADPSMVTDGETGTKSAGEVEGTGVSDPVMEPELAPGEPPRMLAFASLDEVRKLISAAELTDGELDAFLSERNYDMNGISTRSELETFIGELTAMKIVVPEGYSDVLGLTYYPDRNVLDMFFLVGGEKVRVVNDLAYGGSTVICDVSGGGLPTRDAVFGEIIK